IADILTEYGRMLHGPLYLILDQFDEYFLYHSANSERGSFSGELASALSRRSVPAHVLISVRDDSLAALAAFHERVPELLDNLLRIENLDREEGEEAIKGPVERWNQTEDGGGDVRVEQRLVDAVLDQVTAGKVVIGEAGEGAGELIHDGGG